MNKMTPSVRFVISLSIAICGVGAPQVAMAQTCVDAAGSFYGFSTGTSPTVNTCAFEDYLSVGPGTSFLAQDQSSSTSNTYGLEATSINNVGLYASSSEGLYAIEASALLGYGIKGTGLSAGVLGQVNTSATPGEVAGVIGMTGSGGGDGVYGTSTGSDGVYGTSSNSGSAGVVGRTTAGTSSSKGVYGSVSPAGSGYAVYGENNDTSNSSAWAGYFDGNADVTGKFYSNTTCEFNCSSDERLKQQIAPLKGGLDRLLRLKGVTFKWKNPEKQGNDPSTQTGFIAQQVETIFPKWVGEDREGFKTLDIPQREIVALEVESIRTLKIENDARKAESDALRDRLDRLETGGNPNRAGFTLGNGGWGVAGLALGASLVMSRRRKNEDRS